MTKPKYLYHGSPIQIKDETLIPRKAKDLGRSKGGSLTGIYATHIKKAAIMMAMLKSKGITIGSELSRIKTNGRIKLGGIVYGGWPKEKYFYVYTLPSATFKNIHEGSWQWVSKKSVAPIRVEKLKVKNYDHLIRKATTKEKKEWLKKVKRR